MSGRTHAPHRRRRSLTLAAAAAALVGAPLLAGSTAHAEPAGTVTFTGGCGLLGSGLGASSSPDIARVTVSEGAQLRFTNELGRSATLRLDGEAAADVPAGGTAEVRFREGPVTAAMPLSCLLGSPAGEVTVEVSPAPQPEQPRPPAGGSSPEPGTGTPGGADQDPAGPGTGSAGAADGGSGPGSWSGGPAPDGGFWSGGPASPGGAPGGAPSADAEREGDDPDGESPRWGIVTGPTDGGGNSTDPATVDPQAGEGIAADRMSRTSEPAPDDGPVGLLALIATVCVIGVSAGAVRTVISYRMNRMELV